MKIFLFLFLLFSPLLLSAETYLTKHKEALTHYEAEAFEDAELAFAESMSLVTSNKVDDISRIKFNHGDSLFRIGEFKKAEKAYTEAIRTEDLALQQKALYNRGNAALADYKRTMAAMESQGNSIITQAAPPTEMTQDPTKIFDKILKDYEQAIVLDPNDEAAKHNYETVLKMKKEAEQQQQDQENKDSEENQDEGDQEKKEDKDQQEEKKDQDQENDQQEEESDPDKSEEDQGNDPSEEDQENQNEPGNEDGKPSDDQNTTGQSDEPKGPQMSAEEAMNLLNAMRDEEQSSRDKTRIKLGKPVSVDKDW